MHGLLIELAILGLKERRLKAGLQQMQLQQVNELIRSGAAQHRNANGLQAFAGRKLASQAAPLADHLLYVERIERHGYPIKLTL